MEDHVKVMSFLGCTEEQAHEYLQKAGGDIQRAIEENVNIPVVSGAKYIPAPRQIDDGLTPEVREKIQTARQISEQFSASFRNDLLVDPKKTSEAPGAAGVPVAEAEAELPALAPDGVQAS
jgi:predicted ATPase with chaperone activity